MSTSLHSVPSQPLDSLIDGRSGTRMRSRHRQQSSLRTLMAQPVWILTGLAAALVLLQVTATAGEYAFLRSSLDHILPDQQARLLTFIAAGMLIAYSVLCFVVGHRLAVAKEAVDEATERSAGLRAFGPVGVLFLIVALGSLVFLAWRRADVLAERAAAKTVTKAQQSANLLTSSTMPQAELDEIARQAHDAAWWADFGFVTSVMVLLGAVSVAVGLALHLVTRAWLVTTAQMRSDRWATKAGAADTARNTAQDALRTRIAMREDRAELAHRHREAVAQRFAHAREHARVYLAQRLGSPDSTSHVLPTDADLAAGREPRP